MLASGDFILIYAPFSAAVFKAKISMNYIIIRLNCSLPGFEINKYFLVVSANLMNRSTLKLRNWRSAQTR